jgi:GT2 family glycosyltransferase
MSPDNYLLLNNDTEVMPDFLAKLHSFSALHPQYRVLTPKINYYYDKHKIWNCGGKLQFGFRNYYYAGCADTDVKEREFIDISFVTGCALFFYPEILDDDGHLLTERFFFGEEDFEFSMRMKKTNVQMACVLDSLIYHKVGASSNKMYHSGKVFLHYLNRFVDIRLHKPALFYICWAMVNMPLCLYHFYKMCHSVSGSFYYLRRLLIDAKRKDAVTREDFEALVIRNNYFDKI